MMFITFYFRETRQGNLRKWNSS